jgi:hypothetical protein
MWILSFFIILLATNISFRVVLSDTKTKREINRIVVRQLRRKTYRWRYIRNAVVSINKSMVHDLDFFKQIMGGS